VPTAPTWAATTAIPPAPGGPRPGRILGVSCYDEWRGPWPRRGGCRLPGLRRHVPSSTKPDAPRAGLDLLTRAKRELGLPVAAIGGITLDNAPPLIAAGADLLAVISDVFSAPDPAARAAAYAGLFD
jgi:thiamine-phosphate pyrophosphorylase